MKSILNIFLVFALIFSLSGTNVITEEMKNDVDVEDKLTKEILEFTYNIADAGQNWGSEQSPEVLALAIGAIYLLPSTNSMIAFLYLVYDSKIKQLFKRDN